MSYFICEGTSLSGITSSLFCGLTMQYFATKSMDDASVNFSKDSTHIAAHLCEMLIFFQVGQSIALTFTTNISFLWILYAFGVLVIVRIIMIGILSACLNVKSKTVPCNYQVVMVHAGLRGGIAYSLAITFPTQNVDSVTLYKYIIYSTTVWIVLFSLFLLGSTIIDSIKLCKIGYGEAPDVEVNKLSFSPNTAKYIIL